LLLASDATYMAINADNTWLTRLITTNQIVDIGHPALPGPPFPSTLFFDGVNPTALLNAVPLTDLVYGLGSGSWSGPTTPTFGWVATRFNALRLDVSTGVAVRYAGDGFHGCAQTASFTHKQLWQGDVTCITNLAAAAFEQTAVNGDGFLFFAEDGRVHVVDTTLSVASSNVEANVPDSSLLDQTWALDPAAVLLSSGGAVFRTLVPGEYLYVIPGTLSNDVANKRKLYVYNYLTNQMHAWSPPGQPFNSTGGVHYVREIQGGHPADVLLITGEAGTDEAWTIPVSDVLALFSTATAPPTTTPSPQTTTPPPMTTEATRVAFSGDDVRVAQFQAADKTTVRAVPNEVDVFAYDSLAGPPTALMTLAAAPFVMYSDGSTDLDASLTTDVRTRYDHAGAITSGPTPHGGASLGTIPDAVWWNTLEDGAYAGVLPATVVVASTAAISFANRVTGQLGAFLVGGSPGCTVNTFVVGMTLVGVGLCVRNIVAPALLQTLSSRFVYFQVTGSSAVLRLDVEATPGTVSVTVFANLMSTFPAPPPGQQAPVASNAHTSVSGVAFVGGRPGEVFYVRAAAAFNEAAPRELLVWNSLDARSRWVDSLNVRGPMDPGFEPAALHAARLQGGGLVVVFGGIGTTTDFATVPMAAFQAPILPLVDECVANIATCNPPQLCVDSPTSWACVCPPGYHINGFSCEDDDECAGEGSGNNCDTHATCGNTPGSFTCTCNPGFTGDGVTCTDIDECLQPEACPLFGLCTNVPGAHVCACSPGYTGTPTVLCYPTAVDEAFADGTTFGNSTSPTVLVGGAGGYVVTVDRTSTPTVFTPITVVVTNPTEMLVIDFLSVVLVPDAGLGVFLQISGPVTMLVLRNLLITGGAVYTLVAGSPVRVALSDGIVDAPNANGVDPALSRLVLDGTLLEVGVLFSP
jgi:hypothetical protein